LAADPNDCTNGAPLGVETAMAAASNTAIPENEWGGATPLLVS
jgi:hypothetical protein